MEISEFYDSIVLRDFLEYTAPGFLVVLGAGAVMEAVSAELALGLSPLGFVLGHLGPAFVLILLASYLAGQVLTAIHAAKGRSQEPKTAIRLLEKETWLRDEMKKVIASDLPISEDEARQLLAKPEGAETLRQLGRGIVHFQAPDLHREFIGRLSILSRFCQNMMLAICTLVGLMVAALWIRRDVVGARIQLVPPSTRVLVAAIFLGGAIISVLSLYRRSIRLRDMMALHTFQIWYTISAYRGKPIAPEKK